MYRPKIVPDTFSHSDCQLSNCINSMRLSYPELTWFHGFFFEFNSLGEYLEFLFGRLVGAILGIGVLFLIGYLLYLYGQQA